MHKNKLNKKKYIGITSCDVKKRWKKGLGYAKGLPIRNAFDKYGWDNFEHIILYENLNEEDAKNIEILLISEFHTQNPMYGYNITEGGDGVVGWHPSDETIQKISESAKLRIGDRNPNYGHKWSEEQKKKYGILHRRENLSTETLSKMSESASRRIGNKNSFFGKRHSDSAKRKIAEYHKHSVVMFDLNMNFIREFESIKMASEIMGINAVGISNCCRGKTKTSGGYIWKYKDSL